MRLAFAVSAAATLIACSDNNIGNPDPDLVGPPIALDRCTPEFAGFGDATPVEFSHFIAPKFCTFDTEARDATCDVSGCSVPNSQEWIEREDQLAPYLSCEPGMANGTGIDFSKHRGLRVRQGMRVGEWMKREPVVWVVEEQGKVIVAEKRRSFCITEGDVNGGVVSYVLLLPASTSSASIERHAYRNPNGCDMCGGENDCSG